MAGNRGLDQFAKMSVEGVKRAFLVSPHEAAVAGDVGGKYRRELPLNVV